MTISTTRSRRGARDGATLPASEPAALPTLDLGCPMELRLAEDGENGKLDGLDPSSSKGSREWLG